MWIASIKTELKTQSSYPLIEVVTTCLILIIGGGAIIGLQATTSNHIDSAQNHTHAESVPKYSNKFITEGCTHEELASYDLWEWHSIIKDMEMASGTSRFALPGGRGSISRNVDGSFTITVSWRASVGIYMHKNAKIRHLSQRLYL